MNVFNRIKKIFKKDIKKESLYQTVRHLGVYGTNPVPERDIVLTRLGKDRNVLKKLETHPEIYQALQTRIDSLISTGWGITPSEGKQAAFIEKEMRNIMSNILTAVFSAKKYGWSVAERVYYIDEKGQHRLKSLLICNLRNFRMTENGDLEENYNGLWEIADTQYKYLLTVNAPTKENPYGDALLIPLYWPAFRSGSMWVNLMKWLDRLGTPLLLGKFNDKDLTESLEGLATAYSSSVIAIDKEDEIDFITAPGHKQDYTNIDQIINEQIVKIILGQTLTSSIDKSGSYAAAKVHNTVREDKLKSDINLSRHSVKNVFFALCDLNFISGLDITFGEEDPIEKNLAEHAKILMDARIVGEFTRDFIEDKLHLDATHFKTLEETRDALPDFSFLPPEKGEDNQGEDNEKIKETKEPQLKRVNLEIENKRESKLKNIDKQLNALVEELTTKQYLKSNQQVKKIIEESESFQQMDGVAKKTFLVADESKQGDIEELLKARILALSSEDK